VDVATLRLEPASTLTLEGLAELFSAAYEGYFVPVHFDAEGVARMVETNDLDLDAGRVAFHEETPVGLCMLGVRGDEGWIGGMGVVAEHRREGIGEALMRAVLDEAQSRGVRRVRLEVIEQNAAARLLYEKLGFAHLRDVCVWTLDAEVPPGEAGVVPVEEAQAFVREHRRAPEPWQRDDGTLARLDGLAGVAVDGGAAVYREAGGRVLLLQAAALDEDAATALIAALRRQGDALVVLNLPEDDPSATALERLGGRLGVRQHELALEL
jgi:ribosomal protein S18 acetylase RimI-like enzyme